jgi:hypothetical protein
VRVYNWLQRGKRRTLDPDALLERASRRARLDWWGDDLTFVSGLRAITAAINDGAETTPWGRLWLERMILAALVTRLRIQDRVRTEPAVFARPVTRPLFIAGLARTGTTFLQRLLARDPQARTTRYWEVRNPFPAPRPDTYERDRRIAGARIDAAVTRYLNPRLRAIHPTAATWPEEDLFILLRAFGPAWRMLVSNPGLDDWLQSAGDSYGRSVYRYHRTELRHLQSHFRFGHWLLKSPAHLSNLPALLETYPDACVVQTHRDPRQAVPSACSLVQAIRSGLERDVSAPGIGEAMLSHYRTVLERVVAFRKTWPRPAQFYDVPYARLIMDPVGTARGIYAHFGLPWDGELERRMADFARTLPEGRPGGHRHTAEQFGLTPERILEVFAPYGPLSGVAVE